MKKTDYNVFDRNELPFILSQRRNIFELFHATFVILFYFTHRDKLMNEKNSKEMKGSKGRSEQHCGQCSIWFLFYNKTSP